MIADDDSRRLAAAWQMRHPAVGLDRNERAAGRGPRVLHLQVQAGRCHEQQSGRALCATSPRGRQTKGQLAGRDRFDERKKINAPRGWPHWIQWRRPLAASTGPLVPARRPRRRVSIIIMSCLVASGPSPLLCPSQLSPAQLECHRKLATETNQQIIEMAGQRGRGPTGLKRRT